MAKKTGLVLAVGAAALLLVAAAGAEEKPAEKKPEPKPPEPSKPEKPVEPGACVRTNPGDGPGNGKKAAVLAWQNCLIAAGCLAKGQNDGEHGPITEAASKAYEASGGKCTSVAVLPAGGGASPGTETRAWFLTIMQVSQPSEAVATIQARSAPANAKASVVAAFQELAAKWMQNDENRKRNADGTFYVYSTRMDPMTADVKLEDGFTLTSGEVA